MDFFSPSLQPHVFKPVLISVGMDLIPSPVGMDLTGGKATSAEA